MTASSWRIDEASRAAFVELSGDANPLHADPLAARRLPFGRVAVHGMHIVLDTLERLLGDTPGVPRRVRCTFRHLVGVDDEMATTIAAPAGGIVRATVTTDVWTAAEIVVDLGGPIPRRPADAIHTPAPTAPEVHTIESLAGGRRDLPVAMDVPRAVAWFPALAGRLGAASLAELVSLTRVVGMHLPGLHSLDSSFDLRFDLVDDVPVEVLDVAVAVADPRFSRVVLDVRGPTLHGSVTAFVRAPPVEPTLGGTRPRPDEFAGQRWLVVGGSRGLGALAVLLLDSGGADVRFTYRCGLADAWAIAARTRRARPFAFTAGRAPPAELLDGWHPSHLVYMATPPMSDGRAGAYSTRLHDRFTEVYVDAFGDLMARLDPRRLRGVVWPSSAAVAEPVPSMAEFADAKRAGEAAVDTLRDDHPHLRLAIPRLPRLLTDQSASFVPAEYGDGPAEVLAALRAAAS